MKRLLPAFLVCAAILAAQGSCGDVSAKDSNASRPTLPVGRWKVEFSNGVIEVCETGNGGESIVEEPLRRCVGMAVVQGASVVITFGDDRVERWTPVGERFVVEHWYPASRLPTVTPVLGIADRTR